jgi:hypothetical protein
LLFRVAITAVIVLSIHKTSYNIADKAAHPGALRRGDALKRAPTTATTLLHRDLYPIGLLHSTVNAIFPRV